MNNPRPIPPPRISGVPADQYAARWADLQGNTSFYKLSSEIQPKTQAFYLSCLHLAQTLATGIITHPHLSKSRDGYTGSDLLCLYKLAYWLEACAKAVALTEGVASL